MSLYRPSQIHSAGLRPKRSLSQNFLIDQNIVEKTLEAAAIRPGDRVLEIGPGFGAITEKLIAKGATVTAIEKDVQLAKRLSQELSAKVITGDALTFPYQTLQGPLKIVANLPYHIATLLIQKLIPLHTVFTSMTLFVQREVATRICATAGSKDYSSFSLYTRAYSTPQHCFDVSPSCFFPPPKITSSVIKLTTHPFPFSLKEEHFFAFTRTAFGQRRKMLRGTLKNYAPRARIEHFLKELGYQPTTRPTELDLQAFATLFEKIQPKDQ